MSTFLFSFFFFFFLFPPVPLISIAFYPKKYGDTQSPGSECMKRRQTRAESGPFEGKDVSAYLGGEGDAASGASLRRNYLGVGGGGGEREEGGIR